MPVSSPTRCALQPDFLRPVTSIRAGRAAGGSVLELLLLRRAGERERRALARGRDGADQVEPARADLALVPRGRVAVLLHGELALLQLDVRAHAAPAVVARQLEHPGVEAVE